MYNPFKSLSVTPDFASGHIIQWKLDAALSDYGPYHFWVEASETPDFSTLRYTLDAGEDVFMILDNTHSEQVWTRDLWYRVKLKTQKNVFYSHSVIFGAALTTRRNYHLAGQIARKELMRMRRFVGHEGFLLKQKNYGEQAKITVDEISGDPIADNSTDFGVGKENGYYAPVKVIFSIEDEQRQKKLDEQGFGVDESNQVQIRMVGWPSIEVRDYLVDGQTDMRYIVKDCQTFYFPATFIAVVQVIKASLVSPNDPIYKLEIK